MHIAQAALLLVSSILATPLVFGVGITISRKTSISTPLVLSTTSASICNGYAELCTRTFGNVTMVGAHDSYADLQSSPGNIAANQDYGPTTQLNDGVRMLQVQAHNSSGVIHLCHTSCVLLDNGTFVDYLTTVKTWLVANPNEVIAILIVNIDDLPPSAFAAVYSAAGIDSLSYAPPSASIASTAWPTLGSLINSGTRVVTFMDTKAEFTSVPYLIDEFSNVWETAYDVTDQTFNCLVNRTGTADGKMYLINHFLDMDQTLLGQTFPVPNKALLNVTNGVSGTGSLGLQASGCAGIYTVNPTFMLVDFYNWGGGSVFQVAANLNGVTYTAKTVASPITSSSPSSSSSHSSSGPSSGISLGLSGGTIVTVMMVLVSGIAGGVLVV